MALLASLFPLAALVPAHAEGPNAVRNNPAFTANSLPRNDDSSSVQVPIGFSVNFGSTYSQLYVNNNGNVTFDAPSSTYTPFDLRSTTTRIIAPFFADVDTRGTGSQPVVYGYGTGQVDGHSAFGVNWVNVGYYNSHTDKLNSFQLVLIDRSDLGPGNFDMEFNYDKVTWETGDASGGSNGFGGTPARAGYSNGVGSSSEFAGSGVAGAFLDSNLSTGLTHRWQGSAQTGRYAFAVRGGIVGPIGGAITGDESLGGYTNPAEPHLGCALGQSTANPVTTSTGNFWHTFEDLAVPGRGLPLVLTHTYNSARAAADGPLGFGWSYSYGISLSTSQSSGAVSVRQENDAAVTFTPSANGYTAAPRVIASLVKNADGTFTFTRKKREVLSFDASGNLTAEKDLNGYTTTLSRPNTATTVVTDPAGRTLTLTYSGTHLSTATDSASPARTVSFSYTGAGELAQVIDVGGGRTTFTYDGNHRVLTMRRPKFFGDTTTSPSPVVTNHYDSSGRVDWQSDELGRTTRFDYSVANTTRVTDPNGNVHLDRYDSGLLVSETRGYGTPQEATWSRSYDPATLGCRLVRDPNGKDWQADYDAQGNLARSIDPLGRLTTYTYDALNDPTSVTDPSGVTTTMTYDGAGNRLDRSRPLAGTAQTQRIAYLYEDAAHHGDVTATTDPVGKRWAYGYDAFGNVTSGTDPLGDKTTFGYDTIGRRTSTVSPRGNAAGANPTLFTTAYAYDAFGKVISVTDPLGATTTYAYDANGNRTKVTDAEGHPTATNYDAANEPVSVTRADNTSLGYGYDANGNRTSYTETARGLSRPTPMTPSTARRRPPTRSGAPRTTAMTPRATWAPRRTPEAIAARPRNWVAPPLPTTPPASSPASPTPTPPHPPSPLPTTPSAGALR